MPNRQIAYSEIVDLSQEISPATQMFPAYPPPAFTQWTTREAQGFLAETLFLVSHTGTHVDAPWHFEPRGKTLDRLPLRRFVAPGHVLDLRPCPAKARVGRSDLRAARARLESPINAGDTVLLRTGWERTRGTPSYLFRNPGLSRAGAAELVRWRVALVGIDTANIDAAGASSYPAHHTLLRHGIPVLENVANLAALVGRTFTVIALPLKLVGTTGSPVRLVALAA